MGREPSFSYGHARVVQNKFIHYSETHVGVQSTASFPGIRLEGFAKLFACRRLKEAVVEIKKAAKTDPVTAGDESCSG